MTATRAGARLNDARSTPECALSKTRGDVTDGNGCLTHDEGVDDCTILRFSIARLCLGGIIGMDGHSHSQSCICRRLFDDRTRVR